MLLKCFRYCKAHVLIMATSSKYSLRWRHNGHDGVSNKQPHNCLPNLLFGCRSKKTSKLSISGLCEGNSPGTGEFPARMASNTENISIWWCHHVHVSYAMFILVNSLSHTQNENLNYRYNHKHWLRIFPVIYEKAFFDNVVIMRFSNLRIYSIDGVLLIWFLKHLKFLSITCTFWTLQCTTWRSDIVLCKWLLGDICDLSVCCIYMTSCFDHSVWYGLVATGCESNSPCMPLQPDPFQSRERPKSQNHKTTTKSRNLFCNNVESTGLLKFTNNMLSFVIYS